MGSNSVLNKKWLGLGAPQLCLQRWIAVRSTRRAAGSLSQIGGRRPEFHVFGRGQNSDRVVMPAKNRVELKATIRFQLNQLSAHNGAHEFERLAFELARIRVSPSLLPATGPVQAGGDQGRDFESYRSYVRTTGLSESVFTSVSGSDLIVGACSLQKSIEAKVKGDLGVIFGLGSRPVHIAYFCEADVPVAKRHELQEHCRTTYNATLDLFDGQAISDLLADRETFWIAQQFLALSADAWPRDPVDERYGALRERWLDQRSSPHSYRDFLDIKEGLRTATFEEEAKVDLVAWIALMRRFLEHDLVDRIAQKARYEVAVAELRGRGSLDPAIPLVAAFFDNLKIDSLPIELLDAAVLAVYAGASRGHGQSTVGLDKVQSWAKLVEDILADKLQSITNSGDRCMLLEAHAMLGGVRLVDDLSINDLKARFFPDWSAVLAAAKDTPLFPVNVVADILERMTTIVGDDPRFRQLADDADALIAERVGAGVAADRARRRAVAYLDADRYVAAIDELQQTKVGWFSGDTLDGSVMAMLVISDAFEALGLHIAARYYAAGAIFVASRSDREKLERLIAKAAFRLSATFYCAGEGLSYIHCLRGALEAHAALEDEPDDWNRHPTVQRAVRHALVLRALARRAAPHLLPPIDAGIAKWPLPKEEQEALMEMSEEEPWSTIPMDEFERRIDEDLGQNPFNDVGDSRALEWSAFGITWSIRTSADTDTWYAALELSAILQILQVELAAADLLVIPSNVVMNVAIGDVDAPRASQVPDNSNLIWSVTMPRLSHEDRVMQDIAGLAFMVMGQATALTLEAFLRIFESRMKRGLVRRLFSVRPPRELLAFAQPTSSELKLLPSLSRPAFHRQFTPRSAEELKWRTGPGPGYSKARAEEYLFNRYSTLSGSIRRTLPRLLRDEQCRSMISALRAKGLLDWQILTILSTIVAQWQVERRLRVAVPPKVLAKLLSDRIRRDESNSDPSFDLTHLTPELIEIQESFLAAAAFKTWDLASHRTTPDFAAMKRLLDERYCHSTDDISHPDPFPGIK
jgi:hypothetical protein